MKRKYMLGVDLGTSTCKGTLISEDGKVLLTDSFECTFSSPYPGWAEVDAEKQFWGYFIQMVRRLLSASGKSGSDVGSVGCSAMFPVLVALDSSNVPLRPAMLYGIDTRAKSEIEELNNELGSDYCSEVAGNVLSSQSVYPKMLWMRRHEPEKFRNTAMFVGATGYVVGKLTGRYLADHGSASGTLPYNLSKRCWDRELCDYIGIGLDRMPKLHQADEVAGYVTDEAAGLTGLAAGTPVAVGSGDRHTDILSLGGVFPGIATVSYGSTFGMDLCTTKRISNQGLMISRTCIGDNYIVGGGMSNGANLTRWFRDCFGEKEMRKEKRTGRSAYQYLEESAKKIPPGCDGLVALPYFCGERIPIIDPYAKGVIFGLTLKHTRAHIYRAFLESVAFGLRHIFENLRSDGLFIDELYSAGGGTKSALWTQIVSDVTGIRQRIIDWGNGSEAGAAYLGGLASDMITKDFLRALCEKQGRQVIPDPANSEIYLKNYGIFKRLYENTAEQMRLL